MNVGDLIRCSWQPTSSGYVKGIGCIGRPPAIKGEYGIIVKQRLDIDHHTILFPKFGYEHTLSSGAFDVVSRLTKPIGHM